MPSSSRRRLLPCRGDATGVACSWPAVFCVRVIHGFDSVQGLTITPTLAGVHASDLLAAPGGLVDVLDVEDHRPVVLLLRSEDDLPDLETLGLFRAEVPALLQLADRVVNAALPTDERVGVRPPHAGSTLIVT